MPTTLSPKRLPPRRKKATGRTTRTEVVVELPASAVVAMRNGRVEMELAVAEYAEWLTNELDYLESKRRMAAEADQAIPFDGAIAAIPAKRPRRK